MTNPKDLMALAKLESKIVDLATDIDNHEIEITQSDLQGIAQAIVLEAYQLGKKRRNEEMSYLTSELSCLSNFVLNALIYIGENLGDIQVGENGENKPIMLCEAIDEAEDLDKIVEKLEEDISK